MVKLTDAQAALAAYWGLPTDLVEVISDLHEAFPPKKPGGTKPGGVKPGGAKPGGLAAGAGPNKKPGATESGASPGEDKSGSGQFGNDQGQGMMGDEAAKQMQQQQADKERAEMQMHQQADAEDEAERVRLKELKSKAEAEVSKDLNDRYLDTDDKVEFYPRLESFITFKQKLTEAKCDTCDGSGYYYPTSNGGKWPRTRCPECNPKGTIKEEQKFPSKCPDCKGSGWDDEDDHVCEFCAGTGKVAKEYGLKEETRTCPHCHHKFGWTGKGDAYCPHCKQDVLDEGSRRLVREERLECLECGRVFNASVKAGSSPKCPKCGGTDTELA